MKQNTALALLVVGISTLLSLALACVAPFAAVAAIAAAQMRWPLAIGTVMAAWAGNQLVGYGLLNYPQTSSSFMWGAVIALASLVCLFVSKAFTSSGWLALVTSYLVFEGAMLAAAWPLEPDYNAFTVTVLAQVAALNLMAYTLFAFTNAGLGHPIAQRILVRT